MHYRLKVSGCYSDIERFLEEFGAGGFDSFRVDAPINGSENEAIQQISFSNAVMRLERLNNNECAILGLMRRSGLGCDWSAIRGMSEKYYAMGFEVRCVSNESEDIFGVLIRNGIASNSFLFGGVSDLVNVFFTYMCRANFASAARARILSDKGCIGIYTLLNQRTCIITGSKQSAFNFSLDGGVELELVYRESSDGESKTFNVFQVNQNLKDEYVSKLLLGFFLSNVKSATLSSMNCNKLTQARGI